MTYKFKSQATDDLIMLGKDGDQFLRMLGREVAAQGIIEVASMPGVLAALEAAIADETQAGKKAQTLAGTHSDSADSTATEAEQEEAHAVSQRHVALRQRLWPMMDMLRRAHAADKPIVWGV